MPNMTTIFQDFADAGVEPHLRLEFAKRRQRIDHGAAFGLGRD